MGQGIAIDEIREFLERLSKKYTQPIKVYLIGSSGLCFLGSPPRTIDVDCIEIKKYLEVAKHLYR